MFNYLYHLTDFQVFLLLSAVTIVASIIIVMFIQRFEVMNLRYKDVPGLGNVSALIGIIYGVLAGNLALMSFIIP